MTFPNRVGYVPGQQKHDPKYLAKPKTACKSTKQKAAVQHSPRHTTTKSMESVALQQELQSMLTALSPIDEEEEEAVLSKSIPSKEESLAFVKHSCHRLFQDPIFKENANYHRELLNASSSTAAIQDSLSLSSTRQMALTLAQVSPYAKELAARSCLPKKRSSLSKFSKELMHDWFEHNLHHPYPTEEEKMWLAQQGGITLEQVSNWFINTRGRKWKPMLNRLIAEKQIGDCKLLDLMVQKVVEPYQKA